VRTAELLSSLSQRDVRLWIEEGRLKCSAPVGALSAEMRATLASRKEEILAFLRRAATINIGPRAIVPLKPEGRKPPLFAVPGHNGDVSCYVPLARHLDADQPLLGILPPGLDGSEAIRSIEELACYEVEQIRKYRAQGPYLIAGYRAGGPIAFEIAQQLTERRQHVALVALIGSPFPTFYRRMPEATRRVRRFVRRGRHHMGILMSGTLAGRMRYLLDRIPHRHGERRDTEGEVDRELVAARMRLEDVTLAAMRRYRPRPFPGEVDLFLPSRAWRRDSRSERWRTVARDLRECVCSVADDDDHDALLQEPGVSTLAAALRLRLDEIARLERGHEKAERG
jgi:thioesterase domain-containing protein